MTRRTPNLQTVRDQRKRWQSRLTRASNMLSKLAKQEARLIKIDTPTPLPELDKYFAPAPKPLQGIAAADVPAWTDKNCVKPKPVTVRPRGKARLAHLAEDLPMAAREAAEDAAKSDPLFAEKLTKARKENEAEARKQMPLSGNAALAAIKKKK